MLPQGSDLGSQIPQQFDWAVSMLPYGSDLGSQIPQQADLGSQSVTVDLLCLKPIGQHLLDQRINLFIPKSRAQKMARKFIS